MKSITLGTLFGLKLTAHSTAIIGHGLLWVILIGVAGDVLNLPPTGAILGALVAALLHPVSEIVHNLGHAMAARAVGHPMIGIRLWWVLGASVYPKNEPPLPARTHIIRALGGPAVSLLYTLFWGALLLIVRPIAEGGAVWWIGVYLFLSNLFVFTLGAFLPLGFTDGSTLLRYWRR
jgi:hypothetical protein